MKRPLSFIIREPKKRPLHGSGKTSRAVFAPFRVDCSLNDYSSPRILDESCRYRYGYLDLLSRGIQHKVFSFLNVFSPCVTYNHYNTFQWFRPRVKKLEDGAASIGLTVSICFGAS